MLTVGELKRLLEKYEDDVEVCVEAEAGMCYEISGTNNYDDESRPGQLGFFLSASNQLPPL